MNVTVEVRARLWPSRAILRLAPVIGAERAARWAVALAWRLSRWRIAGSRRWSGFR